MGTIMSSGNRGFGAHAACTAFLDGGCKSTPDIDDLVVQVMVANIRCAEIMEEQLRCLAEDQAWVSLRKESENGLVPNFGSRASALLDSCITGSIPFSTHPPGNLPGTRVRKCAVLSVPQGILCLSNILRHHWLHRPEPTPQSQYLKGN